MYPIIVPSIGYDQHLAGMLATSLTGMGVDMGEDVVLDLGSDDFFDDVYLETLYAGYVSHQLTLREFSGYVRDYAGLKQEPWGFKVSHAVDLLPFFTTLFKDASLLVGGVSEFERISNILKVCDLEENVKVPIFREREEAVSLRLKRVLEAMRYTRSLMVPYGLFMEDRRRALRQMAEFLGGTIQSGGVAAMSDSAQRKLLSVYDEKEVTIGQLA